MNTKKEDLDEKEEASTWDLVDAVCEYLMKKEYPKDCTAIQKKRQIRKKKQNRGRRTYLSTFQMGSIRRYSL